MVISKKRRFCNACPILTVLLLGILAVSCTNSNVGGAIINPVQKYTINASSFETDALTGKFNKVVMNTEVQSPPEIVEIAQPAEQEIIPEQSEQAEVEEPAVVIEPNTVYMKGSSYNPAILKIGTGTTVTWKNDDTKKHILNMYVGDEFDGNQKLDPGDEFSHKFGNVGTFKYQDAILKEYMRGEVIVS